jgi:hypothetical protein
MDILAAIKREERKLEKQLGKLNHQLSGVRAAARALGHSAEREEARLVGCGQSGDYQGREEAVGESSEGGEEESCLIPTERIWPPFS